MASATILVPLTPTRVWESAYQSAKRSLTHTMVISKPKTTPMVLYFCLHYQKKRRKTFHAAKSTFVRKLLYGHNYKVTTAITGTEGLQLINSICPDLILLDLGLPDMDGQTIIRQVREWSDCPIIVISARTNEHEKVKALDLGADDYITKPFGSAELLARIRTSLRHSTRMNTSSDQLFHPYKCGELILDFEKRTLTISGNIVHLTPISFQITYFLIK